MNVPPTSPDPAAASAEPSDGGPDGVANGAVVETVDAVGDELVTAFGRLVGQLSQSSPAPDRETLAAIVDNPHSVLFVARVGGEVVGALTLATYHIPTGLKAWIEDVVVDDAARGHGVGAALSIAAIEEARRRGAKSVDLTSRPSREAANRLYVRLGFEARTTNVYRYKL